MRRRWIIVIAVVAVLLVGAAAGGSIAAFTGGDAFGDEPFQEEFGLSERTLVPTGRNTYFILEPGYQIVLESSNEKVAITVLDETKEVAGVTTRVVEEREWKNDQLIEISLNYFAIDEETGDVFYLGEGVDDYKNGEVVAHAGAWLAGENGARPGLIMPGNPVVGMRYFQEIAPDVAMDRAEVVSVSETFETPAGTFSQSLRTKEGTALNKGQKEFKTYAPEIGLIQDEKLLLTEYGFLDEG